MLTISGVHVCATTISVCEVNDMQQAQDLRVGETTKTNKRSIKNI
jgi:hypothetical protein